jgi:DNA helicase-2/ATP-dependent DNA helicase PcrA
MVTPKFEESYKRLNPEQREAVDLIEGPVMVIAGPGTGKTQILTLRIANILLKTQVNPSNILALTFTEAAAAEMRNRLVGMIGTDGYKVEINTFHGFCNNVIKNYPEAFSHMISAEPVTEVEQIQFMEELILKTDLHFLRPFGDPLYYVRSVLSEINNLKKEAVGVEDLEEAIAQQKKDFDQIEDLYHDKGRYKGEMKGKYQDLKKEIAKNEELIVLYKAYQDFLETAKLYDFNDMLFEVKDMMESDKSFLLTLQEKYQYILVDEHQDTNALQNKIVELLGDFFEEPNIFVVGDEKQAIFRFQGASLENFLAFRKLYPTAKLVSLVQNYRSHQKILDAADSLIEKNLSSHLLLPDRVKLQAQNGSTSSPLKSEPIKLVVLHDYFAELQFVIHQIKKIQDKKTPLGEIVVIGRNNKDLQLMADVFERNSIPFTINSDASILSDIYILKLVTLFEAISKVGSDIHLLKAMHIDFFGIEPVDIYKVIRDKQQVTSKYENIYDYLAALDESRAKELKLESFKSIQQFNTKIRDWQKRSHNTAFENFFVEVINESGFKTHLLLSGRRYEILDKLIALFEEVKVLQIRNPQFSLNDFILYLELLKKHDVSLKTKVHTILTDSVNLMTAHRSKGLEYDYVFIINAFDGHWGNSKKRNKGFKIPWDILGIKLNLETEEGEDERRLFYVALTRARKDIFITYSASSMDGKEQIPSQYVTEINPDLIQELNVKDFENEFIKNKEQIFDIAPKQVLDAKNKVFFSNLFIKRGLSATGLDNYLSCPWKFFYRNLLSFPDAKNKNQIYGTLMHLVMNRLISVKGKGERGKEEMMGLFRDLVMKSPLPENEKKELLKKGQNSIPKIIDELIPIWHDKSLIGEMSIKGVKLDDGTILNGRLDMIETINGGSDVIVHDFKTGKSKSRNNIAGLTASSDGNYLRQLTFYKILVDHYHEGKMKMMSGVIDFIEPDEKGKFKSENFEITDQEVEALKNQIKFVASEIRQLAFWDRYCDDKECEYCDLRRLTLNE